MVTCRSCSGLTGYRDVPCVSLDCPVLYDRVRAQDRDEDARQLQRAVDRILERDEQQHSLDVAGHRVPLDRHNNDDDVVLVE